MKKLLIAIFVFANFGAFAQRTVDHQFNSWWTYAGDHKISEKFSVHTLYSFRRNEFVKNWQQSLTRVGVTYKIAPNLNFTLGGDWVVTFPYGKQPFGEETTEYRMFGQFVLKNNVGRVAFMQRFRIAEQIIQHSSGTVKVGRFRYRLGLKVPINNATLTDGTLFATAFDEMFINFGGPFEVPLFDQNWVFIGAGYKFNKKLSILIGYMNQYIIKLDGVNVESNNTLSSVLVYNLF